MTRLQNIENSLKNLNEVVFQELCDSFLLIRNENYAAFSRVGTMSGKQKSTKGTPDLLILLPTGKYIFVEHSTNITLGISKLKQDIEKCLVEEITGIAPDLISEIILCINFNISPREIDDLREIVITKNIKLSIHMLDSLAIELHLHHRDLVHNYLGLPIDTGQIVSIEIFVEEYNKAAKSIATPLDNSFLHREKELTELQNAIYLTDLIILTGAAGVGKTKLALEAVTRFLNNNLDYAAYCISYKNFHLLDDLYQYFDTDKNYLLFVDDANRIDALNQIVGFYKGARTGSLKIIMTARDYAFAEVEKQFSQFLPMRMDLKKMSDEEIKNIISSSSFSILDRRYQDEIIRIADGNPRIAIMAALLAKARQNLNALYDLSDLFDKYFQTFIADEKTLGNAVTIKSLGLTSFFYAIPYKDREIINNILSDFNIDFYEFVDAINQLEKLELIDIQFEHVKIPEQNLALFFFYKAFLATDLLSLQVLLDKYFENNSNRFQECIVATSNTFGVEKVINKLKPHLLNYWSKINTQEDKAFVFMSAFWFYIPTEVLEFIYRSIVTLPNVDTPSYTTDSQENLLPNDKDKTIRVLALYFRHTNHFKDALEVGLEYVKKKPQFLPEFLQAIRQNVLFGWRDEQINFSRQRQLFEVIANEDNLGNLLYRTIFIDLAKTFLQFIFRHTELVRANTISFYNYSLPENISVLEIRKMIWLGIDSAFAKDPENTLEVLTDYTSAQADVISNIMKSDAPFVLTIIQKHLSESSFHHCKYVQDQLRWFKRNSVTDLSFVELANRFTNSLYQTYVKLDWDRLRDKDIFDFEDHSLYEKLKEKDIRESFLLNTDHEIEMLYKAFYFLKKFRNNDWSYNNTLNIIIDENGKHNIEISFKVLSVIIANGNDADYIPGPVLKPLLINRVYAQKFWDFMSTSTFKRKLHWQFSFFDFISDDIIEQNDTLTLINLMSSINEKITLHFDKYEKFLKFDNKLFEKLLSIVIEVNEKGQSSITAWADFFSTDLKLLGDIGLVKKAYLQQIKIQTHFDFHSNIFLYILKNDRSFLLDYIKAVYAPNNHSRNDSSRSRAIIWIVDSIEIELEQTFNYVSENEYFMGVLETHLNNFFLNLSEQADKKANEFLLNYVIKYSNDTKKINMVVDVVRNSKKELFERVLLLYLTHNQDADDFSKIWWRGNGGVYKGDVIVGDLQASEWREILNIVEKSQLGIVLLPVKKYILSEIDAGYAYGDIERKRKFIDRD